MAAFALRRASHHDAADVVADCFVVAWRRFEEIPAEPDTRAWLIGVARNVLANQRRGRNRQHRVATKLAATFRSDIPAPVIEHREDLGQVAAALQLLSPADRELLLLVAWDGLTPREIAIATDANVATVRSRLHRARKRLERAGRRRDGEPGDAEVLGGRKLGGVG